MKGIRKDAPSAAELAELRILARAAVLLLRREMNLTQSDLARLCGGHQPSISLIEKGRSNAPVRILRLLVNAAGIVRMRNCAEPLALLTTETDQGASA